MAERPLNLPWTEMDGEIHGGDIDDNGHTMIGEFTHRDHALAAVAAVNSHAANQATIAMLTEALAYYADLKRWLLVSGLYVASPEMDRDHGDRARAALAHAQQEG